MKFKTWLYLAGGVVWAFLPLIAQAALVPCGVGSDPSALGTPNATGQMQGALSCNMCYFGVLIQNVINFLVGVSIPISVLMFGWAGILMFTSAGNAERRGKGKKIFQRVFVGFVIVITGWLIVQTILGIVVTREFNFSTYWNGLDSKCRELQVQRETQSQQSFNDYINSVLGNPPPAQPGGSVTVTTGCIAPMQMTSEGYCQNPITGAISAPTAILPSGAPAPIDPDLAAHIAAACAAYGGPVCSISRSISLAESSGGKNCRTSDTGAVGCFQVLPTTACRLNSSVSKSCKACVDSKQSLSAACQPVATAIAVPTVNTQLGVQYVDQLSGMYNGRCDLTAAAYYRGPGNVRKAGNRVPVLATGYVAKVCGG